MNAMSDTNSSARLSDLTEPFAKRFQKDARILAMHAAALYRDERFSDAATTLDRARTLDSRVTKILGDEGLKAIDEGRKITPKMAGGLKALEAKNYGNATTLLREALAEDPRNDLTAHLLSQAIANQLRALRDPSGREAAATAARELDELCRRFPNDAEMRQYFAVALRLSGSNIEAAQALDHAKRIGGHPEKMFGVAGMAAFRA